MKDFLPTMLLVFIVWIIATNKFTAYLSLVSKSGWNITGSSLLSGLLSPFTNAVSSAEKSIGSTITTGLGSIGTDIIASGAEDIF
jgi:hypothetical protein